MEYFIKNYGDANPMTGLSREDKITTYSVGAGRKFAGNVEVSLNETYTRHASNVNIYDFERSVFGISISKKF